MKRIVLMLLCTVSVYGSDKPLEAPKKADKPTFPNHTQKTPSMQIPAAPLLVRAASVPGRSKKYDWINEDEANIWQLRPHAKRKSPAAKKKEGK